MGNLRMQKINQEVISFLQNRDVNFEKTQNELSTAQGDLKKFQILFEAMGKFAEGCSDSVTLEKAMSLAEKAHSNSVLDSRCLISIVNTFERILNAQNFISILEKWDAPQEIKNKVIDCRESKSDLLDLNGCKLSSFPSSLLGYLPCVRFLDLGNNQLASFILKGPSQLQLLNLRNNKLELFDLEGMPQLEVLDLSWNLLTSFALEGASKLKELYVYHNKLKSFILEGASEMESLYISDNKLAQEPQLINCNTPTILNLTNNPYLKES